MTSTTAQLTAVREPEPPPVEAARWVASARRGDSEAILALLRQYRPPLVRLLTGITADAALAEDVAQEAFLHAFRSLPQLRDPSAFYPWVRRLATRLALRALQRRPEAAGDTEDQPASEVDPARQAETRLAVQLVLGQLPAELRAVLVLREMEQLDYQEIAEALDVPLGTVRSRLHTARERFREQWTGLENAR
jgi:RNA polymerase sigma-70 factor (ECF subfamily)